MPKVVEVPNLLDLTWRYLTGESIKKLASEAGCNQDTLERRLREMGVQLRSPSDAMRLRWKQVRALGDREALERWLRPAWNSRRGWPRKSGGSKEGRIGKYEREIADLMRIPVTHQATFRRERQQPYRIDILTEEAPFVAVEIQRSPLANSTTMRRERLEYLFGCGVRGLLCVYVPDRKFSYDLAMLAEKCVAFVDLVRANDAPHGQYGMIRGDAEPFTAYCLDLDGWTRVPGF